MKKLFLLAFISALTSCISEDKEDLPRAEGYEKTVMIDGCEYIEYKSTLYCGHQYTHHEYKATFLTHKGHCKNHEQNTELRTPKTSVKREMELRY